MPDEPLTRESMTEMLRDLGFRVSIPTPEPCGLGSDPPVLSVVPDATGFDVLDGHRIVGTYTDAAAATAAATDVLARAGGGQLRTYGPLHLITAAVDVPPAPGGTALPDDRNVQALYRWVKSVGTGTPAQPGFPPETLARVEAVTAHPPAGPSALRAAEDVATEVLRFVFEHAHLIPDLMKFFGH